MPTIERRQAALIAGGGALVVALIIGLVLVLGGDTDAVRVASPETSAEEGDVTTTSTVPEGRQAVTTQVATVVGPLIDVYRTIPDPAVAATAPAAPDPPAATATAVGALPRDDYAPVGAFKTADGWQFESPTYYGTPQLFVVTAEHEGWLRVLVPARPNHQQGWIDADDVEVTSHQFAIELDLSDFMLRAYDGTEQIAETQVVIGAPTSPTPTGTFYTLAELPRGDGINPGGPYGAWILPTSGYSETLDEFDDGVPVIALHGTNNPGAVGQARSNGCVRMPDEVVSLLADRMPFGTPVIISE